MEVADQWQREWAGTAEYGKVTEGGVTRRIARAMEVLHASAPGARVRVMRAAYHSTAGPGAPAASFMLHSSRRVISSGFNLLESPTRPLEISSMPLESSPDSLTENYKVTEPDDLDISEPSKWRSSKASSFRMPSEESSSTDNASIIDLDPRGSRNLHRKYSYDSESSDVQFGRRSTSRASPLLDSPVTLSSLKYKSLLIGSNEWNSRRKSYSFEDTSPLNETILQSNDTLAMESSTDSGICKSSEIVNEHIDENTHMKILTPNERRVNNNDESFQDWLSKNRSNSHHKTTKFKNYREHNIVLEEPIENNITVKATGKVSITLPVINSSDDDIQQKKTTASEDSDRKVKKVEFCKTELHFAAETGKVNIIATDEKPPPSNDFRKRRSAFVPMQELIDKPITLFGDKNNMEEVHILNGNSSNLNAFTGELEETDENTAATKSILKNKIPKPKPYLLGENMAFGLSEDLSSKDHYNKSSVLTAVSLVNRQLEIEKRRDTEVKSVFQQDEDADVVKKPAVRTLNKGPVDDHIANYVRKEKTLQSDNVKKDVNFIKNRFNAIQASPVERRAKTRELRQSDLTYFGIDNVRKRADQEKYNYLENRVTSSDTSIDDIFHSVKLIQQVSNSLCNSEVESDDGPDYQNLPINVKHAPIPTPRSRSKYDDESGNVHKIKVLRPIIEKDYEDIQDVNKSYTRRSKLRRQEETVVNRSLSAPPKCLRNGIENPRRHEDRSTCSRKDDASRETVPNAPIRMSRKIAPDDNPIYVNLSLVREKLNKNITDKAIERNNIKARQNKSQTTANNDVKVEQKTENPRSNRPSDRKKSEISSNTTSGDSLQKKTSMSKHSLGRRAEKSEPVQHYDNHKTGSAHKPRDKSQPATESVSENKENRSRATQRRSHKTTSEEAVTGSVTKLKESNHKIKNSNIEHNQTRSSSKDKLRSKRDANIVSQDLDSIPERQSTTEKVRSKGSEFHKSNSHRSNKKSEYVINYDDKNGTVSSVTKVRSGVGSPQRKKSKETSKHKTVTLNKIALLQIEDHQEEANGLSYADRKWKTKIHLQRSCQVL